MRYLSDDGKVFNTEQDCCEHEQKVKRDRVNREQREKLQKLKAHMKNQKNWYWNMDNFMAFKTKCILFHHVALQMRCVKRRTYRYKS